MKRILNLNDFSSPALIGILGIGLGLPAVITVVSRLLGLPALQGWARVLAEIGAGLLGLFFVLVIVEQIQDHLLYRRYLRERGQHVDGECPYCGNRQIRSFDHFCGVCGKKIVQDRIEERR
jgi:ribosomal protein S27E